MAQKSELIQALEQIEREKGVKKEDVLLMIEGAIASALKKHLGRNANVVCAIDPETADISAKQIKIVAEAVIDPETEISLDEARKKTPDIVAGTEVEFPVDAREFARIAAQTAKQVLVQKIREIERDNLYEEFKPKEGEMTSGSVHRYMDRNIIVDMGKAEAVLPIREQIRRERYAIGDRVRAVILKVDKVQRGPQIVLSRASPVFLKRLFEMEVPEIGEKIVEIVDVVRDPGFRAKVVVRSNNPKVDAVGACVGIRGSRIRSIMNELSGERIDLIPHSPETQTFIANAIAPGKASSVRILDDANRQAEIIVPNDQLALTIGKDGQNIRLACKLTGWSLNVKSEAQKTDEVRAVQATMMSDLRELEGIGPKTAETLTKSGFHDIRKLSTLTVDDLTCVQGVGPKTAEKIIDSAKKWVAEHPAEPPVSPAAAAAEAASPAAEPLQDEPKAEQTAEKDAI
ncbi:MAG TPA: transcription termination/antitermination protein NusA [Elusimicrobia bacterium]|nr:transcription termination/antitermination protein NusA [Elusimicrobiota bacterium]